jgi:hypothetical protein
VSSTAASVHSDSCSDVQKLYSRGRSFAAREGEAVWVADVVARFPALKGRLFLMFVPGSPNATFRDSATAELLRTRVREILGLP